MLIALRNVSLSIGLWLKDNKFKSENKMWKEREKWNNRKKKSISRASSANKNYAYISIWCFWILFHRSLIRNSYEFFSRIFLFLIFSINKAWESLQFHKHIRHVWNCMRLTQFIFSHLSASSDYLCASTCGVQSWNFTVF